MDFPKKQQQCLIPRYLLQYLQDLQISHNDPTAPWGGGGGGGSYTAGDGIDITNDVISIDDTVALKSDIPSLTGYATETWVTNQGYLVQSDLSNYVTSSELITELGNYVTTTDLATELLNYAELDDIPTKTSDLTNDSGFITSSALTNYVTTNTTQIISGDKIFTGVASFRGSYFGTTFQPSGEVTVYDGNDSLNNYMTIYPDSISVKYSNYGFSLGNQQLQVYNRNNQYKIKITDKNDTTTIGEYTFKNKTGDVAITSEIPDAVSGTNDGTNWTSLTIGNTTYNIPSGGGGSSYTAGTWINIDSNNSINVSNPYISLLDSNNNPRVMISSTTNGTAPTFTATYCNITPTGFGIVDKTQGSFGGYSAAYTYYRHRDILVNNKWSLSFPTDFGTIATQEWTRDWVTNKGYVTSSSLADVATSGSYNDLIYKPTIPTISGAVSGNYWTSININGTSKNIPSVSGSYSGSYWTKITINGTTKSIPSGGSSADAVDLTSNQNITGVKTFVGKQKLKFKQTGSNDTLGFTAYDYNNVEIGNLQIANRAVSGSTYPYVTLGNFSTQNEKAKVGFRIQPNSSQYSYNFVMPYGTNDQFTNNGYSTTADTTIPCAFTDGTTIVKADATGLVNISSISGGGGGGTTVSGTNDGTNWTSLTIGSDTYGIPSGGGGGGSSLAPQIYNFTSADWTADTSTNGYISNTAMAREGLDLSTLSAGQTVKIDCIFVRPSNSTSYVHQFTLVIPDGTMATESTDTFQIPGTNSTSLQIEAWMQRSTNRIGLFWSNDRTRYISKVKVYPANA